MEILELQRKFQLEFCIERVQNLIILCSRLPAAHRH